MSGDVLVGTWREDDVRYRMSVDVRLEWQDHPSQTITHDEIGPHWRFTVMGSCDERRSGRWMEAGGGQNRNDLPKVTDFADGWDAARRDVLVGLWDRWHLNDMRAGCAHQTVEYENDRYSRRVPSLTLTQPCPISGYKYGHAWLVEPIPDDVLAIMRTFTGSVAS